VTTSFPKVDYSLRPAKHAERRMICEIFSRLRSFRPVEDYLYVGFGSVWFADFVLFHRALGIKEMISIEHVDSARPRIEANKPFRAITVDYRKCSAVLPSLDWKRNLFLWLDYEDTITEEILLDIKTVAARACSGTVLTVSVKCTQAPDVEDVEEDKSGPSALERFRARLGRNRVDDKVGADDLYWWPFSKVSRKIILSEIEVALAVRNGSAEPKDQMNFKCLCEINYADGAAMTTIVGIFCSPQDKSRFDDCGFEKLAFMPPNGSVLHIEVPKLTIREIRFLERQLPKLMAGKLDLQAIPEEEAQLFADLYRYLPNFAILEN
jgi:hypothetical protein